MIIYIGQFWTAILEFRRHLDFVFYLVFINSNSLSLQHTFWHKYQLCSSNTRRYRQHYTLPAAILSFGRHLGFRLRHNLCPGIFLKLYILPTYPENFMLVSRSEIFWHYMTRPDCTSTAFLQLQIYQFCICVWYFRAACVSVPVQNDAYGAAVPRCHAVLRNCQCVHAMMQG